MKTVWVGRGGGSYGGIRGRTWGQGAIGEPSANWGREAEGQGSESSGLPAGFPQHRVFSTLSKPVDLFFS